VSRSRLSAKGRRENGKYAGIPHAVMEHQCYTTLSSKGIRLLLELARQYNGHNNGDLSAAWFLMQQRGWRSRDTVDKAEKELEDHDLIMRTRQGGKNACTLYALTWVAIDECKGKLDVRSTNIPPGDWQRWEPK
jgi:hypothetical protein